MCEKSVLFSFQSPKPTNQLFQFPTYPKNRKNKLGPRRFFEDGRQTPRIGYGEWNFTYLIHSRNDRSKIVSALGCFFFRFNMASLKFMKEQTLKILTRFVIKIKTFFKLLVTNFSFSLSICFSWSAGGVAHAAISLRRSVK